MAFSDWNIYKTGNDTQITIDTGSPIVGSGSLRFNTTGSGNRQANLNVSNESGIDKGFIRGIIKTVCNVDSFDQGFSIGIACLQSQADISGSSGDFYTLTMRTRSSLGIGWRLYLYKFTNGLDATPLVLQRTDNSMTTLGTNFVISLRWNADILEFGGTQFVVSFANNTTDLGNLAEQFTYVDTIVPYTTSVAEGLFCKVSAESTEQVDARFDSTETFQLV